MNIPLHSAPLAALSLALVSSHAAAKQPAYPIAPGTPTCTAEADEPIVCAWSIDGLNPIPEKYAVEAIASYDPDCNSTPDLSTTFEFATVGADPIIDIPTAALDTVVCTSGDNPCTTPVTYHAKSVQVRVKAKAKGSSQSSPFSGLSTTVTLPGVCLCPEICVTIANRNLAVPVTAVQNFHCGHYSNAQDSPTIYWSFASGTPTFGYLGFLSGSSDESSGPFIGVKGACIEEGPVFTRLEELTPEQGAACLAQFAPQFAEKFAFPCDPYTEDPPFLRTP